MREEIKSLTSLRFFAALWVFIFHINLRWPLPMPAPLRSLVSHGAVGMSIFFILSGFVLGARYREGIESLAVYSVRRFGRIYPVYMLAALVTLPFFTVTQSGPQGWLEGTFVTLANILMLQAWFPPLINYWNVGASWSLSAEAFFYASFPLLIKAMLSASNRSLTLAIAVAYALSVFPGLGYLLVPDSPTFFYSMPIFRLPEFVVGVGASVLVNRKALRFSAPISVCLGSLSVLTVFLAVIPPSSIYVTANIIAVPCFTLIIVMLAQKSPSWLEHPLLSLLGRASYAFYSLQPLVILTMILLQKNSPSWSPIPTLLLSFMVLTFLSVLTYNLIEEPTRKWLAQKGARHESR